MKFLKPIVILFLLFSTVLSGGCGHTKEDQERIIRYLDNRFGKDTYTIKQDESYYRWFVTLNQYPDLTVYYTVSRDPLSMTSPSITTNFDPDISTHIQSKKRRSQHCVIRRNLPRISAEAKNACGQSGRFYISRRYRKVIYFGQRYFW